MNKKKSRKIKRSWGKILVCVFFLGYVGYTVVAQQIDINNKKAELAEINEQITVAENEKNALAEEVQIVNTPEYMEYCARTELGYAASDEIVFIDSTTKD